MKKILFVCLGNICRSPLAEAIFNEKVKKKVFLIVSLQIQQARLIIMWEQILTKDQLILL